MVALQPIVMLNRTPPSDVPIWFCFASSVLAAFVFRQTRLALARRFPRLNLLKTFERELQKTRNNEHVEVTATAKRANRFHSKLNSIQPNKGMEKS
jgi:hypothetical protein